MRALAGPSPALAALGPAGVAAAALWTLGRTDWAPLLHHGSIGGHAHAAAAPALVAGAWLAGWALMVVAMMLPMAAPFLGEVRASRLRAFAAAGFLAVWCGFGVVLLAALTLAAEATARVPWIDVPPHVLAAGALVLAGLYQASRTKGRSLGRCRDHRRLLPAGWASGPDPSGHALRAGVAHGLSSLGCCWPLMALMVVLGIGGLAWMLAIAAVAALEAGAGRGARLRLPLGALLVVAGLAVLATGLPALA